MTYQISNYNNDEFTAFTKRIVLNTIQVASIFNYYNFSVLSTDYFKILCCIWDNIDV